MRLSIILLFRTDIYFYIVLHQWAPLEIQQEKKILVFYTIEAGYMFIYSN